MNSGRLWAIYSTAKKKAQKQGQAIEISRHATTSAKKAAEKKWRQEHGK